MSRHRRTPEYYLCALMCLEPWLHICLHTVLVLQLDVILQAVFDVFIGVVGSAMSGDIYAVRCIQREVICFRILISKCPDAVQVVFPRVGAELLRVKLLAEKYQAIVADTFYESNNSYNK